MVLCKFDYNHNYEYIDNNNIKFNQYFHDYKYVQLNIDKFNEY